MSKRKLASNIVLLLFLVLVGVAALLSDIFQSPVKTGAQVIEQARLLSHDDLSQVTRLALKNKSGEFIFDRDPNNQITPWHMVSPRNISANSLFIEKLFTSLSEMKVKKIFPDEKINNSNFSLDKPTSTLFLTDKSGKAMTIQIGLMNTIDNSTYVKIAGKTGIFHVEAPSVSLENATILDLIESQIISIDSATIVAFRIYRGNKKSNPQMELKKKNGSWVDREGNTMALDKLEDYLQDLSVLKSSFIIDKQTDSQKRQIANLSHNAQYIVSVEDNKGNIIDYNISALVRELSDIDLKNEDYFVVTISNNSTAYVVKKEFHELFNKKSESLKAAGHSATTAPAVAPKP
jgi:hypothetical protein